jgi:putative glutamine amidotransferase
MKFSMTVADHVHPRIGIPWRAANEEAANNLPKMARYLRAVERAGGQPVLLSLLRPTAELKRRVAELDGFLLSGSPADVDPSHFHAGRHPATEDSDAARERTDFALLEHAMTSHKPVLAICYGIQSLNVFLGGSLVQDIPSEVGSSICHSSEENEVAGGDVESDPLHGAQFDSGHIFDVSHARHAEVNSSHHQSVLQPGHGLRITARAPDGVVEGVEWTEDSNWVVGVQWHPERMLANPLAKGLFKELVSEARHTRLAR